jgi:hypothetical protein
MGGRLIANDIIDREQPDGFAAPKNPELVVQRVPQQPGSERPFIPALMRHLDF